MSKYKHAQNKNRVSAKRYKVTARNRGKKNQMEILDLKNVTEIKKLNERAQQQNGRDGGKNQ